MATFAESTMLVSLNVRSYGAKKEDKKISREVAANHATSSDAGKYNKALVSKNYLEPITKSIGALRSAHYDNTLPWLDEGIRVLPSANYESYRGLMTGLVDDYDAAVRDFVRAWPEIIEDAKQRLNGMFNPADYPTDIASRFGCSLRFMPVSDATDFRVSINDADRDELQKQIAATLGMAQDAAMRDIWERLADAVKSMADKLAAYKRDASTGKVTGAFRDSLVENLRDLCGLIPRLNFTGDAGLEAIRREIERELLTDSAEDLRDSDATRAGVAAKADDIVARIGEFMTDSVAS